MQHKWRMVRVQAPQPQPPPSLHRHSHRHRHRHRHRHAQTQAQTQAQTRVYNKQHFRCSLTALCNPAVPSIPRNNCIITKTNSSNSLEMHVVRLFMHYMESLFRKFLDLQRKREIKTQGGRVRVNRLELSVAG
jgi:hypothetical protein